MLLVMDIGNSAMKAGLFGAGVSGRERVLARTRRFDLSPSHLPHEYADMLKDFIGADRPASAAIASVVPEATAAVAEAAEALTGTPPLVLDHETDSGLILDIALPASVGADRIAGAVGAVEAVGAPVAVVDFGTATTVGFVFESDAPDQAVFKGGAIMPGLSLMGSSLASGTAKLPEVD
ncbi:MAG: type III pantothenate kinase, partial [Thermodesulfovibrionales bacterium]|nr:type III pantothenate kinase [Thermodesulfovibrionales bacterium]